jgi:hypothetical protein
VTDHPVEAVEMWAWSHVTRTWHRLESNRIRAALCDRMLWPLGSRTTEPPPVEERCPQCEALP